MLKMLRDVELRSIFICITEIGQNSRHILRKVVA